MTKNFLSSIFLIALTLYACGSNNGDNAPEMGTGSINGVVALFNDLNVPRPNDGMTVSIVGRTESVVTDAQGNFLLSDIPYGEYQLQFEKSGYGTFISDDIDHFASNGESTTIASPFFLGQISTTTISESQGVHNGDDFLFTIETEPAASTTDPLFITIFFNGSSDVSNASNSAIITRQIESSRVQITVTQEQLYEMGFSADQTAYIKIYGDSFFNNSYSRLGSIVHPNVNSTASPTFDLVVQ